MHPDRLTDIPLHRALGQLPGWSRKGDAIVKSYAFPNFMAGVAFVNRVARVAEAANHHPDLDLRYSKVVCTLTTHSAGGITQKDLDLAGAIERVAAG